MTSMQLVKDEEGQSYIPPSQRPDGTWRKPIRVRDGYVPQEEQPVYISKGRQPDDKSPYPVGLSSADIEALQARSERSQGFPVGYFEVGDYFKQAAGIPGLNFAESSEPLVPVKAKSKKSKNKGKGEAAASATSTSNNTNQSKGQGSASAAAAGNTSAKTPSSQAVPTDPTKRLRNLKKRLKEIEDLEKRISSGELSSPEKEQLEKLKRKDEVVDDIEELERLIADLNVSS